MSAGTVLLPDRYRDPRLIAVGGMGQVYLATDDVLGREVAVKVLADRYSADETVRERFKREALAAARLSSEPGIVMIYDVGELAEQPFIVMEYLPGGSLHDIACREGAQPPAKVVGWLEDAADALDRAHAVGIVHRDVKPANLLCDGEGRVHVADFGVASAAGLASLTETGTVIGTAGYLSPEQAQGGTATPASDRYALAIVAWELLAGSRPFANANAAAEATAHVFSPVPSLAAQHPELPRELDAVFARALAKNPADRYPTSRAFVAALRAAFAASATPTRVVAVSPTTFRARRRRSLAVPLALVLLGLSGAAAAVIVAARTGDAAPAAATHVVRVTVREPARTVSSTVVSTSSTGNSTSGATAAAQGFAKMQAGDYTGALPLLQQAAQQLQGSGSLSEAYNDFNLALALAKTEGCSPQVLQLLDASQAIQGHRPPIDQLRQTCTGPAAAPTPPGPHGSGPKPGNGPKPGKGPKKK